MFFYFCAKCQENPLHYIAVELSDYTAIYFHLTCFRFAQARSIGFIRVPSPDNFLPATVWSSLKLELGNGCHSNPEVYPARRSPKCSAAPAQKLSWFFHV